MDIKERIALFWKGINDFNKGQPKIFDVQPQDKVEVIVVPKPKKKRAKKKPK